MALSYVTYTASAAATNFSFGKGYIEKTHVYVYVDEVLQVQDTDYIWFNSSTIQFLTPLAGGETVIIQRYTPKDARLVDFASAGNLTEFDLDTSALQMFYLAQEAYDAYGATAEANANAAAASAAASAADVIAAAAEAADAAAAAATAASEAADAAAAAAATAADVSTMAGYFPLVDPPVENNAILQDASGGIKDAGSGLVLIEKVSSGRLTITKGGTFTIPHGMGAVPDDYVIFIECVTTDAATGLTAGEFVGYKSGGAFNNGSSNAKPSGVQITFDTTNMKVVFSSSNTEFLSLLTPAGAEADITPTNAANFKLHVNLFYYGQLIP